MKKVSAWLGSMLGISLFATSLLSATALAANSMPISFHAWNGSDFRRGTFDHTFLGFGGEGAELTLMPGASTGTWTSDSFTTPTLVNKIVTSWQAKTPQDTWIETHLQVQLPDNSWSGWYDMGHWTFASNVDSGGAFVSTRGSVDGQDDATGFIAQDTFFTNNNLMVKAYRVQEVLHGKAIGLRPSVRQVAATAADISQNTDENGGVSPTSTTTMDRTISLPVPALSEYAHNDEYPQLDGGGKSWCSPASVSMVLDYWGKKPSRQQINHLPADSVFDSRQRADGEVDYAAFHIFDNTDPAKDTGDWPFNMGYAASFGVDASVRQYNSLQSLESWIKKGVPVVITIKWDNTSSDSTQHLDGSSMDKTPGHLMVVRGFTKDGAVIANDPASPDDASVPHVYNRAQFEHLWLRTSSGTVYIVKPQFQQD